MKRRSREVTVQKVCLRFLTRMNGRAFFAFTCFIPKDWGEPYKVALIFLLAYLAVSRILAVILGWKEWLLCKCVSLGDLWTSFSSSEIFWGRDSDMRFIHRSTSTPLLRLRKPNKPRGALVLSDFGIPEIDEDSSSIGKDLFNFPLVLSFTKTTTSIFKRVF